MVDRRALIVGSWLTKEKSILSNQKFRSITNHWTKILEIQSFGYKSLTDENIIPTPLINPSIADLTAQFEDASNVTADTELLLYYLGESTPISLYDIKLALGEKSNGEDLTIKLSHLLGFTEYLPDSFNKLVIILDTCHAARTLEIFRNFDFEYFAMCASDDSYAFNGSFSEGVFKAFEDPLRARDQRIDRKEGGVTYNKIFEYATKHVTQQSRDDEYYQQPKSFGDYEGELLISAPSFVPDEYVDSISSRSIYARVYRLLEMLDKNRILNVRELRNHINDDRSFLIRRDEEEGDQYISQKRINEYLEFLRDIKWLEEDSGIFRLTENGRQALNRETFNKLLLESIEEEIFPKGFGLEMLEKIVIELLDDMIPPTPIKIHERTGMKGIWMYLNSGVRVALQLLPSTGRFLKGSASAIFPSEF